MEKVIEFILSKNGIGDKSKLAEIVKEQFNLTIDRKVYYSNDYAIRFSSSKDTSFSNTALSLSTLQKYDNNPFYVCLVTPKENKIYLANSSFLSKISHSSKELRIDNIKGSFNGSDIIKNIDGIANVPQNFDILFPIHQNTTFNENLERLVEVNGTIIPTKQKFTINDKNIIIIKEAPTRAISFNKSKFYSDLLNDLNTRTTKYKKEILIASLIENVKLRGNIIEYIIAGEDEKLQQQIAKSLFDKTPIPPFKDKNGLGDFIKTYPQFDTATDIKTKIMVLNSAPKGYNIDKMLEFLSNENSIFMFYFVGIDYEKNEIKTSLVSVFQKEIIDNTIIQFHWAGRNSRGVAQFIGKGIKDLIVKNTANNIVERQAIEFLEKLIAL